MILVGLTGAIQHGKNSFADALLHEQTNGVHLESSAIITETIDKMHATLPRPVEPQNIDWVNNWLTHLPNILKETVHVDTSFEKLQITKEAIYKRPIEYQKLFAHTKQLAEHTDDLVLPITAATKSRHRPLLQWLGGYLVTAVGAGIWFDEIAWRAKTAEENGTELFVVSGLRYPSDENILRRINAHIVKIVRPDLPETDINDPTERSRNAITPDTTIINNGTLDDLFTVSKNYLNDIVTSQPKKFYIANDK